MNRHAIVLCVGLAACSHSKPQLPPSDAEIIGLSHQFMTAFDRGDAKAIAGMLGTHYVHYEGSIIDRDKQLAQLATWNEDPASHTAARVWSDEHVFARASDAIFIGHAKEHQAGNDVHGGYDFDGTFTFGWSREGDSWKLVYWTWAVDGDTTSIAIWNQIFSHGTGFNKQPNKLLAEVSATHAAGTAIDVACGQGRNALYLANKGWDVTGVDNSEEAVRQLRDGAAQQKLNVHAVISDVTKYDYGTEAWDLVAMIYAYPALKQIGDLQRATKHGGLFVYEYFAPTSDDDDAPKPGALAKQFAGWEILRDEIVDGVPDWRQDRAKIQRFVARKR